jgi:hypothetical protein
MFTEINIITLKALASFAILTTSRKTITSIIPTHVTAIVITGVLNFSLTLLINSGKRLSLDIAKGKREAAKTPALAVEIRVITPTTAAMIPIVYPPSLSASVNIGLMSVASSETGMLDTRTKDTTTYIAVISANEASMDNGRFLEGFFISSAIAATLVTPE